ncbi:MAG: hypothetical protein ABI950_09225, partial [Solirubrobacteraceae bacterium]
MSIRISPSDATNLILSVAAVDAWVRAARAAHVRPLIHVSTSDLRPKKAKLISSKQYRRNVGSLVRHLKRLRVRDFGVWNEANHKSQPTYDHQDRAALRPPREVLAHRDRRHRELRPLV